MKNAVTIKIGHRPQISGGADHGRESTRAEVVQDVTKKSGRDVQEQVAVVKTADDVVQTSGAADLFQNVVLNRSIKNGKRRKILKAERARGHACARIRREINY